MTSFIFLAGAEVLNEGIHEQDGAIGDDDKDGGKGTGQAIAALSANSLIRTVMSRNCGVTSRMMAEMAVMLRTNEVTKPLKKESLDEGESDGGEHLAAARTQIIGGFLDALYRSAVGRKYRCGYRWAGCAQ